MLGHKEFSRKYENNEESVAEFAAMLESYGLLQKALNGSLSELDILRYNSILESTVVDYRLKAQMCVR